MPKHKFECPSKGSPEVLAVSDTRILNQTANVKNLRLVNSCISDQHLRSPNNTMVYMFSGLHSI